jgi:succinoglycan biosynthesis protein ExoM
MSAPDISIVICTYNRADLLKQAMESIAKLANPDVLSLEVVIVDNSDDNNARPTVDAARDWMPYPISMVVAHPANISVARNAGVKAALSEIVAFMDDDQTLEKDWLIAVWDGLAKYPHDVLFGAVSPVAERPELVDASVEQLFSRQMPFEAGQDLVPMGRAKTRGISLATNNSVFRRASTFFEDQPFNPAFGNGGGEDFDLFCRLQRKGCRFGWLPAAKAIEYVPAKRCNSRYLEQRFYAGGQAYAMAVSINNDRPRLERWRQRLLASIQFGLLMLSMPKAYFGGPELWLAWRYRVAGILGKLSFRKLLPIYQN